LIEGICFYLWIDAANVDNFCLQNKMKPNLFFGRGEKEQNLEKRLFIIQGFLYNPYLLKKHFGV